MGASVCKKCKRAYPKYLDACPNCTSDTGVRKPRREASRGRTGEGADVSPSPPHVTTPVTNSVMEPGTVTTPVTDTKIEYGASPNGLVPGEPCPMCGKRVGRDAKQRQREWRAKRKEAS